MKAKWFGTLVTVLAAAVSLRAQTTTLIHSFGVGLDGVTPGTDLVLNTNVLFGTTAAGGVYHQGTLFTLNADGSGYRLLHSFGLGLDGTRPSARLALDGGILYGTTAAGGPYSGGTLFRIDTAGNVYRIIHSFGAGVDGLSPYTDVLLDGTAIYGATLAGGAYRGGTIFKVNSDGSGYLLLHSFGSRYDGITPSTRLVLSDGFLFGTTSAGGAYGGGTVFKVSTNGFGYLLLHNFGAGVDGVAPFSDLVVSNATVYGTTAAGGPYKGGTLFQLSTDGNVYLILHNFGVGIDGINPSTRLVLNGLSLFGSTSGGGAFDSGTIFRLDVDSRLYTTLHSFGLGLDGAAPYSDLIMRDTTLFGTTAYGGAHKGGTVFSMNSNGSGYTVLHDFGVGLDGVQPVTRVALSGTGLFGTTAAGGVFGAGTIFRSLVPVAPQIIQPVFSKDQGKFSLSWNAMPGLNYQLQYSTNQATGTWTDLGPPLPGSDGILSTADPNAGLGQCFYRIRVVPAP